MKNKLVLNDNEVDANKVSFIGKIDTKVFPHLNRSEYYFSIVVDGKQVDISCDTREEVEKLRNQLSLAT